MLDVSGPAADDDVFQGLRDALGANSTQWTGARVRLEIADGRVVGAVREKLPDRLVEIVNSDVIKAGRGIPRLVRIGGPIRRAGGVV